MLDVKTLNEDYSVFQGFKYVVRCVWERAPKTVYKGYKKKPAWANVYSICDYQTSTADTGKQKYIGHECVFFVDNFYSKLCKFEGTVLLIAETAGD